MTGTDLRALREHVLGMSQEQFAEAIGAYDSATVRRWERRDRLILRIAVLAEMLRDVPEAREWLRSRLQAKAT